MLHSLFPKAHRKFLSLPLLGPIADGFDDWLAANGYTRDSRANSIRMLKQVDADLRRRHVKEVGGLTHLILHDRWRTLIKTYPSIAGTVRTLERYLAATDLIAQGTRNYALVATMFNTGARVQEIADLRASDLQLTKPFQVRLFGKGKKERYCLLWPQTAAVLRAFSKEQNLDLRSADHAFLNHRGRPLTRFGIRYILAKCLDRTSQKLPNLRKKRLHPHSMRHSTAVALLKSGVDLSTISHYLGHNSLATTNRYAKVDLEMKRKAIAQVKPVPRQSRTPWSRDPTVLDWLESL
jgi:site-specific recombinase XerD